MIDLTMRVSMNASEFAGWLFLVALVGLVVGVLTAARYLDGKRHP